MGLDDALTELRQGDLDARRAAVRWLWRWSRDGPRDGEPAIAPLETALTDDDALVRGHAVGVLGDLLFASRPYDEPMPELDGILAALTDEDEGVRQTATGALWNREWWYGVDEEAHPITSDQRELAAVGLVACLTDSTSLVRERASEELPAAFLLDHPEPEAAMANVVAALDDDRDAVRANAAALLAGVTERRPDLLDPHLDRVRRATTEDDAARTAAVEALSNVLGRHPELATPVVDAILETDAERSGDAVRRIETLGDVLTAPPDGFERTEETLAALESALGARDLRERLAATELLRRVAATAPDTVEPVESALVDRLADHDEDVRKHAACALADVLRERGDANPPLAALVERYADASPEESVPDPLVRLAPAHPTFVRERLEAMREETPELPHSTRTTVASILATAPDAVRPVLERCAADLNADDRFVRDGAAWLLGELLLEQPDEGTRYESALRAALDSPDEFDDLALKKLRAALEGPTEEGADDGGDRGDRDGVVTRLRDRLPF